MSSGVSPDRTSTSRDRPSRRPRAVRTASPVPRGSFWTATSSPANASVADGDLVDVQLLGIAAGLAKCAFDAGRAIEGSGALGLDDEIFHAEAGEQHVGPVLLQPDLLGRPVQDGGEQFAQDVLRHLFCWRLADPV